MAYTTIDDPSQYFNTVLWTGNGGTNAITGVGFKPDWVWGKDRTGTDNHHLFDTTRGTNQRIISNLSAAENTESNCLDSFDSDGFTLGSNTGLNNNTDAHVAWCWKAGTSSGLSGGDITPSSYSYNATSGFGIYKYTGNGSTDQEIPHGLGKKPQMIFFKRLDSSTNWVVQSNLLGNRVQLVLNGTDAENTDSRLGASDDWSSTIFNVGTYGDMNSSGDPHVAYAFCNIQGYSKIGTYTGNGDADGSFVYTGFKPAFVMTKKTSSSTARNWCILDNKRSSSGANVVDDRLFPNLSDAEDSSTSADFLSNGFKLRDNAGEFTQAVSYIYMAFAEAPFVNSNGVPCNAR